MRQVYADMDGGQIHYILEGSGESILLLHQTPLSSNEYAEMIPILGESYQVIAIDTPGYGKSSLPPRQFYIEDYARCVLKFMDFLRIDKASIVGSHTGAAIAVETAVMCSERVDRLVLSGCPHYEPEVRKSRLSDPKYHPMEIKEDGSHLTELWRLLGDLAPQSKPDSWHRVVVDYLIAGAHAEDAHYALFRYDIEPRLPLIENPTLLVSGTEDMFYHRLEVTKKLIPRCRTAIIEGGGIVIAYERAKEFAKIILDFVSSLEI